MRYILILAWQSIRQVLSDRTAALWMVVMPLVYIFVFGSAFRGGNDPAQSRAYIAVWNQDQGALGQRFMHHLESENLRIDTLTAAPAPSVLRAVTIPDSFSRRLSQSQPVSISFVLRKGNDMEADAMADLAVKKAQYRLLADLTELAIQEKPVQGPSFLQLDQRQKLILVQTSYAGKSTVIPRGFAQQVPANIVMFTMLSLFIYAGTSLVEERQNGLLRRMLTSPLQFHYLFWGRVAGITCVGLLQSAIILFMGRFFFAVHLGARPLALAAVVLLFSLTVAGMGITLGLLIRNEEKMIATAIIVTIGMSALSGCWFPLEITPRWFEFSANFLPSGLAIKSLNRLISYGYGWKAIWPYLLGLGTFLTGFALLSARLMRRSVN